MEKNGEESYGIRDWPVMPQQIVDQYRSSLKGYLLDRAAIEHTKDALADIHCFKGTFYPKETEIRLQAIVERLEAIEIAAGEANDSCTPLSGNELFARVMYDLPGDINFLLGHILTLEKNVNTLERLIHQNSLLLHG
jgi:hypothetical protein